MTARRTVLVSCGWLLLAVGLAGCFDRGGAPALSSPPAAASLEKKGFLDPDERPDSVVLLPPPPAPGSEAMQRDETIRAAMQRYRDTPRWRMAAEDADLQFPGAVGHFACALGIEVSRERTPALYGLMQRTVIDAGQSTLAAKEHYRRPRPFTLDGARTCLPDSEESLRSSPSYPSGHASLGWAWGLLLADLVPERAVELRARGASFGQSRVVCDVHWQSDVDAGRTVAETVVARLQAEPEFKRVLERARAEVSAARQGGAGSAAEPDPVRCEREQAVLAERLTSPP